MIYKLKGTLTSAFFVVLILLVLSFIVLTPMISMIILGAAFAYVIRPLSLKMEPSLKFRSIAIVVAMIIIIIPLIILLIIIINSIVQSIPSIILFVKNIDLNSVNIHNNTFFQHYLPQGIYPYINSSSTINIATDILKRLLNYFLGILESIPMVALQLFIFFASTFYFARDGDKLWEYVEYVIPQDRKDYFKTLFKETDRVLKSIFIGHFFTALLTGVFAGIGFWIIGYPFAPFLGILTGFFQLIPFIGHWPIPIILSIYDFINGNYLKSISVLILGVLLSIIDIYIRPKLSGKYADIHPMIFMVGFLSGPLVFGLVGFIIGPLILGVTYAAVVAYKKEKTVENNKS